MYYINLTLNMDESVKTEALAFVKTKLIPKINELIDFSSTKILWVKTDGIAEGITYAIQFETAFYESIKTYHQKSDLINQWIRQKFNTAVLPFATELHSIETV